MTDPARNPAAPVDEGALALSLRPFGSSVMLPPAAYTDPAVFGWEQQHLLGGGWTCVGFSAHLPEPGVQPGQRGRRRDGQPAVRQAVARGGAPPRRPSGPGPDRRVDERHH